MGEYVIILVGIAIICIAIVVTFGGKIATLFGFAGEEVETLGDAEWGGFAEGPGGGPGSAPNPDAGGSEGGSSEDQYSDPASGGGGGAGGARRGGRGGDDGGADGRTIGDGVAVNERSKNPRTGQYEMGEGDRKVAVNSPGGGKGSAAYDRRRDAAQQRQAATADQAAWERRKQTRMAEDAQAREAAKPKSGMLGFMRFVLLIAMLLGVLVIVRQTFAMKGGGGGD